MYCPKCGTLNPENSKFCSSCGLQLDSIELSVRNFYYAGFWRRFAAFLIDAVIVGAGVSVVSSILGHPPDTQDQVYNGISILAQWLYFTLLEGSDYQATIGKMALNLQVVDFEGNKISFAKANLRYWSKILSAIVLGIGFLMIAFTEKKQGLHDKIAGTLVIQTKS